MLMLADKVHNKRLFMYKDCVVELYNASTFYTTISTKSSENELKPRYCYTCRDGWVECSHVV